MKTTTIQALRRMLALLLCLCMVLPCVLTTVTAEDALTGRDDDTIILEYLYLPEGYSSQFFADETPLSEISDNAIILEYGKNVSSVKLSYKSGDNWIDITDAGQEKLPADAEYQFEISYNDISVDELIEAGGQMVYEGLPDWFIPSGKSVILHEGTVIATVEEVDGKIVVTFDPDWLEEHKGNKLSGPFKIGGKFDWHNIPAEEEGRKMPGIGVVHFEDNLAQKYGHVTLDKSQPELVKGENGEYYLKYTLTVTNEDSVEIPDIKVRDAFTTASYIEEYVGVTVEGTSLANTDSGSRIPWEEGAEGAAGELSGDDSSMLWNIGTLQPGETRTLTYFAQIADNYVSNVINNPITNKAEVYSGEILKDTDMEAFAPKNDIQLKKSHQNIHIGPNGTGTISYTVTMTAPADNSFVMKDLMLNDTFPAELKPYLSGEADGQISFEITTFSEDGTESSITKSVDYADGSFALSGLELAPGGTVTVTYTVNVTNIFFASNDQINLTNTATVSKGERSLRNTQDTVTLEKQTWTRKVAGNPTDKQQVVEMNPSDGVYIYDNEAIREETDPSDNFTVPEGSIQYQVILNEGGQWDLSSTTMTDTFDSDYMSYVGYVQIQLFERAKGASGDLSDQELIEELEGSGSNLVKTVWLKIDGQGSFTFHPKDLGLPENTTYTYLLTYYAKPQNMDDMGSVQITNSFKLEGIVGDGNGGTYPSFPGIEISVGKVVQGGVKYDAEKISWYYASSPVRLVYDKALNGSDIYGESDFSKDYQYGAIYWVIRLEGDIASGSLKDKGKWKVPATFDGFYIKDTPGAGQQFVRDAIVGVYLGDKGFDFTSYDSFPDFVAELESGTLSGKIQSLNGNPVNQKYFDTIVSTPDYEWCAEGSGLEGISFSNSVIGNNGKYDKNTQAIYVVLRTALTASVPTEKNTPKTYTNKLYIPSGDTDIEVDEAEYTYVIKSSMLKESKGAYIFDKSTGTFTNCSSITNFNGWYVSEKVDTSMLETSGIYATWLLNINTNGIMDGTYDIVDYLPEGMELVYADVNNYGNAIKRNPDMHPKTEYVQELSDNPDWKELEHESLDDINNMVKTITYYNESTGEIRWHISNFTAAIDGNTKREINLRIICKVVDPELVLNQEKTYENTADILDPNDPNNILETETADVTIYMKLGKDWDWDALERIGGVNSDGKVSWPLSANQLPFKIDINPFADDLCDGDTLPALIDELSNMELIEDSIEVRILDETKDGIPYTDFTYDVNEIDGRQVLIISGLPDSTPLRITYKARITAAPNTSVPISNTAYWAGYEAPKTPQVDGAGSYLPSTEIFVSNSIKITIIKVDADSHSKKLDGAVFELYEVDGSTSTKVRDNGVSNSLGIVIFDNTDPTKPTLKFDTVYCIKEAKAPNGYELDQETNQHYFVIVKPNGSLTEEQISALKEQYKDLDVWYDSPEYGVVLENKKGSISVNKVFVNENGEEFTPASGKYRFGLFNAADVLLETLTIEYINGDVNYYLDGIPKENPRFTKYDPEIVYQVYELDANNNPIREENGWVRINDIDYRVTYSSDTPPDRVTVGSDVKITNTVITNPVVLPETGGMGLIAYYTAVSILMILLLFSCLFLQRYGTRRK